MRRAHRIDYEIDANWKIVAENYSECYHCPSVHPQLHRISDVTTGSFHQAACFNGGPMELRPGFSTMSMSGISKTGPIVGLPAEQHNQVHYYVVYPNLMLGLDPDYLLVHRAWPLATAEGAGGVAAEGNDGGGDSDPASVESAEQRASTDDHEALTTLPAERSPWPMLLFTGVALIVGALLLRWIVVPRAG